MTRRHIHYEAAFEQYLRCRRVPYIPVDEARKAVFSGEKIKSFDFLVYGSGNKKWLLDVKGRQFPYCSGGSRRYWENWVAQEDIDGLLQWEKAFGEGFSPVFVFAYWLRGEQTRRPTEEVFSYRDELYSFVAVPVEAYLAHGRIRSKKWGTLSLPTVTFREVARPMGELLQAV